MTIQARTLPSEDIERLILEMLNRSDQPTGAPQLFVALSDQGIRTSEATVGRFLRLLDQQGLTTVVSKRGRLLSELGHARLRQLDVLAKLSSHNADVARIIHPTDVDALLDLLYVRRALEPEAARLAAIRATDEQRCTLRQLTFRQLDTVEKGKGVGDVALQFHRVIAQASHNSMLVSVAGLILDTTNDPLADILEEIAARTGSLSEYAHDHKLLEEAISVGDADSAEREMRSHIDDLIGIVESYKDLVLKGLV